MRREPNFGFLLAGIILFLTLGPVADLLFGDADGLVLMSGVTLMLITALWSLQESRGLFIAGIALACMSIVLVVLDSISPSTNQTFLSLVVIFLFEAMSLWLAGRHLFSVGPVTLNRLMGGIAMYLLLGLCFTNMYVFALWFYPDSFSGLAPGNEGERFWELNYFSFVTLTTLGYGDIRPAGDFTRSMAITQAVAGQLYVAILIGALVAGYISENRSGAHGN